MWPLCPGPRNGEILLRVPVSGFLSGFQKPEGEQDIAQTLVKFGKKQIILLFLVYYLWPLVSAGPHHCSYPKNR